MTTPAVPVVDPITRARAVLGLALAVVAPEAIPLKDGSVRLTSARDLLAADVMDQLGARLAGRAADRASDDRILAEAVALLGSEITRARGGASPADGATAALDALLDVPDLPPESRAEAAATLRGVLEGSAETSESAAERLAALSAVQRRSTVTDLMDAAREISREAQVLRTTQPGTLAVRIGQPGSRRRVLGRHRYYRGNATTATRQIRDTGLFVGGRPSLDADLTEDGALAALQHVQPSDLGGSVTAQPTVLARPHVAVFETASLPRQHVRVEITPLPRKLVAQADIRSGDVDDPHVLRISPRLNDAQLSRVWVSQFSHIQQEVAATRAGRPTGIVARIGSALRREGRDRALTAQYDEFRHLTRNWYEARATNPHDVAELERDLRGLATAIDRRGGTAPALPWTRESIAVPVVAPPGLAAAAAPAPPNTPAHLRDRVNSEIETLDATVDDLQTRADAKTASAAAATRQAKDFKDKAADEVKLKDQGAPERARKMVADASLAEGKAQRHTQIAAAYQEAADNGTRARAAYQAFGGELDAIVADPRRPATEVLPLAQAAADQVESYRASIGKALPRHDVLHSGAPTGRLPHLTALTKRINEALEAKDLPPHFTTEMLHRTLRAEFRRVMSPDGLVLPVGGDATADVSRLPQIRLKLQPGELAEVLDPDVQLSELMVGHLEQSGHGVSSAATHTFGRTGGFSLKTVMAMLPESSALKAVSEVVTPGFEFAFARNRSVNMSVTNAGPGGGVEDNRGESVLFEGAASWELELRTSALDEWSFVDTIDSSGPRDADALKVWVSGAYTVPPPAKTVDLTQVGRGEQRDKALPEHVATDVRGLNELSDKTIRGTRTALGSLDRVGHDQIRELLTEDLPSRLEAATKPGGIGRLIYSGGKAVAYAQVETEAVWEKAELVGEASLEHWQERLRVDFSGATGSEAFGASSSGSVSASYAGTALSDLGTTTLDLGPKVKAGRSVSRNDSMSAGGTAIHPSVQRYTGPTQGYRMRLKHKVTMHQIGGDGVFTVNGGGKALLRIPENDAYRYGLPVHESAVQRSDGQPMVDKEGRTLLRGDPQPTKPDLKPPTWQGNGTNQMRGAGPALVQRVTGADAALDATAKELSRQKLLPPLDANGRPMLDALPRDPLLRASQLQNFERLSQHISALRLETGYDQAAQGGLPLALVDHRTGHAPQYRTFRIGLHQKFGEATCRGVTTSEAVVNLDIASRTSGRSGGRSKRLPWSVSLGLSNKPGKDQAGQTPEGALSYGRASLGRLFSWASGGTVNQVTLVESTAPVAVFDVPHRLVVTEVTAAGDSAPLVEVDGSASVLIDSDLVAKPSTPPATPYQGLTDEAILKQSKILHLDVGDPLSRIRTALPAATQPDSAAYHHLAAFLNPRNLIAHPEWRTSGYRTRVAISPAPSSPAQALAQRTLLPQQSSVTLTGRVANHVFMGATHQVSGDINLTLSSYSTTAGSSTGNSGGLTGGDGSVSADGDSLGGSGELSRTGSSSHSRTDAQIWGWERLRIDVGQHYVFGADLSFEAEVTDGESAKPHKVKLDDGTMLFTLPEREALRLYGQRKLDLPLEQVADATERFLEGGLTLDRRAAASLVRRYRAEKVGVTEGLAATHSDQRLAEKLSTVAGLTTPPPGSAAEKVATIFADVEQVAAQTTEVSLPEHYRSMMGAALIEDTEFTNESGQTIDVHAAVSVAIEQAAPGRLANDPVLLESLDGDLADKRWQGHLDDMLDPRGFVKEYPVRTSGTGPPEMLVVRARALFDGPIFTDGTPEGANESALIIVQGYDYDEHSRTRTRSTSYAINTAGEGADGISPSGGVGTDRSRTVSATSGEQSTRVQRLMHNQTARVERQMRIVIEVERRPVRGGATNGWLRQGLDRSRPQERGSAARTVLSGRLTQLVPKALINTAPTSQSAPERQDHRTVTLPSSYFVEGTRPYLSGEPEADKLFDTVAQRLARPDMLGAAGARMHRTELENQLSASARSAAFERMASDEGHAMVRLPVVGHGRKVVDVQVRAVVSDLQLVGEPMDDVQIGEVDRIQRTSRTSTTGNRLLPATGTVGGGLPGPDVKGSVTVGEQFSDTDSDTTGNRNELSKFEQGTAVTVRVRVDYDLTFERKVLDRQGDDKLVRRSAELHGVAAGEAYLTMFHHEYLAMRERMESGAPLSTALEGMSPQIAGRHHHATEFTENPAGQQEYRPYQPLLDALAEARKDQVTVQVTVRERDGQTRSYQARPDGTMRGANDGGYAAAFATLHPRLAQLSEGRVDLRELFNTSPRSTRFTGAVSEALQQNGVPASVLSELDHSLAARPAAVGAGSNGARQTVAAHNIPAGPGLSVN
ncbi:MAG: hypothetical protein QOH50_1017 [Kribbellaceae bacterium]|nr:hypothetical protein [Kribbellaceae bacterium]